ncbi:WW domain-binding protein 11-like [Aquila chrysaetos chrysaetos]|uniref:WW domain-binding protein 11-like n=1 Tax=Aquila chrysaetos chrysaetos TaxID=223781 RepID=UPI00117675EA|nr:WW domain-binding protein 11-like [Aquila chrysaetos chrysaetos]
MAGGRGRAGGGTGRPTGTKPERRGWDSPGVGPGQGSPPPPPPPRGGRAIRHGRRCPRGLARLLARAPPPLLASLLPGPSLPQQPARPVGEAAVPRGPPGAASSYLAPVKRQKNETNRRAGHNTDTGHSTGTGTGHSTGPGTGHSTVPPHLQAVTAAQRGAGGGFSHRRHRAPGTGHRGTGPAALRGAEPPPPPRPGAVRGRASSVLFFPSRH